MQRDKPVAALAEVSNLGELDNVASSSNLVLTTVASRCEEQLEECVFGGKAASLAAATQAGLPVPAGVALPIGFVDAQKVVDARSVPVEA